MPPTPSTGSISFEDIIAEFGNITDNDKGNSTSNPDPVKLGDYRTSVSYKSVSYRLDEGVPTGDSSISFDDLRGKRLNIIVKVHTSNTSYTANAKDLYDDRNRNITIVGNGREKEFKNSRIHIVVTGTWGSVRGTAPTGSTVSQSKRLTCAVRTGNWTDDGETPESVDLRVGGSQSEPGYIIGGGGDGGKGGASDGESDESEAYKANGSHGCIGTSALGLDIPLRNLEIREPGRIQAGCGGGGGGGGAGGELTGDKSNERAGGGGGGGGSGVPYGLGGAFGYRDDNGHVYDTQAEDRTPQSGTNGASNKGGNGGRGGNNDEEGSNDDSASGGGGGAGGGIDPGEGGDGTEEAEDGAEGEGIDGTNAAEKSGEGGEGGDSDAEGQGQQEGLGGLGGQHGLAIDIGQNPIESITGQDRIYGRYNLA